MTHPAPSERPTAAPVDSIEPASGWHVAHLFYAFDRPRLESLSAGERAEIEAATA